MPGLPTSTPVPVLSSCHSLPGQTPPLRSDVFSLIKPILALLWKIKHLLERAPVEPRFGEDL